MLQKRLIKYRRMNHKGFTAKGANKVLKDVSEKHCCKWGKSSIEGGIGKHCFKWGGVNEIIEGCVRKALLQAPNRANLQL